MSPPVLHARFLGKRWHHHSRSSGYDRIIDWLGTSIPNPYGAHLHQRLLPERMAIPWVQRAGVRNYDLPAFYHEWAAFGEMLRRREHTVYHLLYGDDSFRYLGALRALARRHRVVASFHLPPSMLESFLPDTQHLSSLDAIIIVSEHQRAFFTSHVDADRVHCVPHGIDVAAFSPRAQSSIDGQPYCLFVGMHARDFTLLRHVARQMALHCPQMRLVIVSEAAKQGEFLDCANVDFRVGIDEPTLVELYRGAVALLQPLLYATANNAILEALACGVPIVVSDVPGVRDYVDETCARLVPPGHAWPMVAAILALMDDSAGRAAMARAARARALELDWDRVAERVRTIYRALW